MLSRCRITRVTRGRGNNYMVRAARMPLKAGGKPEICWPAPCNCGCAANLQYVNALISPCMHAAGGAVIPANALGCRGDALFGTGFSRKPSGPADDWVHQWFCAGGRR